MSEIVRRSAGCLVEPTATKVFVIITSKFKQIEISVNGLNDVDYRKRNDITDLAVADIRKDTIGAVKRGAAFYIFFGSSTGSGILLN